MCWLCWEAATNESLRLEFPDRRENIGNFSEDAPFPRSNPWKSEVSPDEFPTIWNREFFVTNSEACRASCESFAASGLGIAESAF